MCRSRGARIVVILLSPLFFSLWLSAVEGVKSRSGDGSYLCGDWIGEFFVSYDLTGSFKRDIPVVQKLVPELFRGLAAELPGSKFAVGFFADKPPNGAYSDVPYGLTQSMTEDIDLIAKRMESLKGYGGMDWEEAQLEAMFHGVASKSVGWTTQEVDELGKQYIRFFIVATDAGYHKAGDNGRTPHSMDADADCSGNDYPSEQMVIDLFQERNIKPIFLLKKSGIGIDEYVAFNEKIGTGGLLTTLDTDSTNLIEAIMTSVQNITCTLATTTTTTTTTSTTTTPLPVPTTPVEPGGGSGDGTTTTTTIAPLIPPPGPSPNIPLIAGATAGVIGLVAAAGGATYAFLPGTKAFPELEFEHSMEDTDEDKEQMTEIRADQFASA